MKPFIPSLTAAFTLSASTMFAAGAPEVGIQADTTESKGNATYATGHVRITHHDATMQADHAIYDPAAQTITLDGNVQFEQRKVKRVTGLDAATRIVYHLDRQALDVKGLSHLDFLADKVR